jgi:hypothetical protein
MTTRGPLVGERKEEEGMDAVLGSCWAKGLATTYVGEVWKRMGCAYGALCLVGVAHIGKKGRGPRLDAKESEREELEPVGFLHLWNCFSIFLEN